LGRGPGLGCVGGGGLFCVGGGGGGGEAPVFTNVPCKRKLNIDLTLTCCCFLVLTSKSGTAHVLFWFRPFCHEIFEPEWHRPVTNTVTWQHGYVELTLRGFQSGGLGSVLWQTMSDLYWMQCPWDSVFCSQLLLYQRPFAGWTVEVL